MDRRSWLWRRRSSEKSSGETESSGSISSHSERFSDEQVYTNQNSRSHEVNSKTILDDVAIDDVKSLKEKLEDAISQIRNKEDSAKQHAKVAEEAVAGWEKAENEVIYMGQQLEALTQKNMALEDRMSHVDGALKECVRQLRQAKEEQGRLINEAVIKKTEEWETQKSELHAYYSVQHTNVVAEMTATGEKDHLQVKLDVLSTENASLKQQLLSLAEEMKVRTLERDYSIQAAETASKHRLESSRKMARLEAESLRLKSMARKAALSSENRSVTASSIYVESITDNQSDCGDNVMLLEADLNNMGILVSNEGEPGSSNSPSTAVVPETGRYKNKISHRQNIMHPHVEFELLDDFVEMERMALIPERRSEEYFSTKGTLAGQPSQVEITLKAELDHMINCISDLEEKLKNVEALNVDLSEALVECQNKLKISQTRVKENEEKFKNVETLNIEMNSSLVGLQNQLQKSQTSVKEYAEKWVKLKTQIASANESKQAAEKELRTIDAQKEEAEAWHVTVEAEKGALLETVRFLECEIEKERSLSAENISKCLRLKDELSKTKIEVENKENALLDEVNKNLFKCQFLEEEVKKSRAEAELNRSTSKMVRDSKIDQEEELQLAAQQFAECQKTIASLGKQLKSLATLDDFLLDSDNSLKNTDEVSSSKEQAMDFSDSRANKVCMRNNDSKLSISNACHSNALQNLRVGEPTTSRESTCAFDRSRSGLGKLSSRGKTILG